MSNRRNGLSKTSCRLVLLVSSRTVWRVKRSKGMNRFSWFILSRIKGVKHIAPHVKCEVDTSHLLFFYRLRSSIDMIFLVTCFITSYLTCLARSHRRAWCCESGYPNANKSECFAYAVPQVFFDWFSSVFGGTGSEKPPLKRKLEDVLRSGTLESVGLVLSSSHCNEDSRFLSGTACWISSL